ncbi:MAG: hypothetical protein Q8R17_00010 [bacterium]|nr:hypothetical protein [bacterium]
MREFALTALVVTVVSFAAIEGRSDSTVYALDALNHLTNITYSTGALRKYSIPDFDESQFVQDLKTWFDKISVSDQRK